LSDQRPAFPISEKAYAKLNISLDVTARRADGYHDMLMIMQTISLCDELTITPEHDGLVHAVTSLPYVPGDRRNLAVRAALRFLELVGDGDRGVKIAIRKNIPVGAGMAGGSSDAAAVLRALNRAYGGPLTLEELCAAGEDVGSDVAFCLRGGTVLASGRGEILRPIAPLPSCSFVVCKPDFSISTPELFRKLDEAKLSCHPDTDGLLAALEKGDLDGLCRRMYNVFEDVPDRRMRTIRAAKGALLDCGALGALMTGTGSAVFGVFRDRAAAEAACGTLKKEYRFCCTAEAVGALL
jgi:4-diphosphocytidyl-2-C-methyl-D-erythritol kinase